jgi:hypothetical protein
MNEEDEAFEDLAKRQGDWGMQGSRKHQIMRYAENVKNKGTSMTDKEAMKLALDALETLMIERGSIYEKAIAALKERLAQPEQEPFAYWFKDTNWEAPSERSGWFVHMPSDGKLNGKPGLALYTRAFAQSKPVAWVNKERNTITWDKLYPDMDALYTHPPQRTEQNFCPRCGKRTNDIHTCTPPKD